MAQPSSAEFAALQDCVAGCCVMFVLGAKAWLCTWLRHAGVCKHAYALLLEFQ
jgi:hypothetical protein